MTLNRRELLRAGGAGALFAGFLSANTPLGRVVRLAKGRPKLGSPKVFTIFLRGAQDGVHTVVPVGDSTYTTARFSPSMQPATVALGGSTYARLNADYSALQAIDGAGHAAFVHQCGNLDGSRSHFVEQQIWESGFVPTSTQPSLLEEGVIARLSEKAGFGTAVPGASVSNAMQRFYLGFTPTRLLAHVRSLADYTLGNNQIAARQRDAMLLNLANTPSADLENFVDATGEFVLTSEAAVNALAGYTHDGAKFPQNDTEAAAQGLPLYGPGYGFMKQCEEATLLMLASGGPIDCQAIGVEIGGWDTHTDQDTQRALTDRYLAHAIRSVYDLAIAQLTDFVILVVTEFGRTNFENSKTGTDHGVGSLLMAFGPRVNGGVYNCYDPALGTGLGRPWRKLGNTASQYSQWTNAQPVATDFRKIYAELFVKLFGLTSGPGSEIADVIPGWTDTGYLGVFN